MTPKSSTSFPVVGSGSLVLLYDVGRDRTFNAPRDIDQSIHTTCNLSAQLLSLTSQCHVLSHTVVIVRCTVIPTPNMDSIQPVNNSVS